MRKELIDKETQFYGYSESILKKSEADSEAARNELFEVNKKYSAEAAGHAQSLSALKNTEKYLEKAENSIVKLRNNSVLLETELARGRSRISIYHRFISVKS